MAGKDSDLPCDMFYTVASSYNVWKIPEKIGWHYHKICSGSIKILTFPLLYMIKKINEVGFEAIQKRKAYNFILK